MPRKSNPQAGRRTGGSGRVTRQAPKHMAQARRQRPTSRSRIPGANKANPQSKRRS